MSEYKSQPEETKEFAIESSQFNKLIKSLPGNIEQKHDASIVLEELKREFPNMIERTLSSFKNTFFDGYGGNTINITSDMFINFIKELMDTGKAYYKNVVTSFKNVLKYLGELKNKLVGKTHMVWTSLIGHGETFLGMDLKLSSINDTLYDILDVLRIQTSSTEVFADMSKKQAAATMLGIENIKFEKKDKLREKDTKELKKREEFKERDSENRMELHGGFFQKTLNQFSGKTLLGNVKSIITTSLKSSSYKFARSAVTGILKLVGIVVAGLFFKSLIKKVWNQYAEQLIGKKNKKIVEEWVRYLYKKFIDFSSIAMRWLGDRLKTLLIDTFKFIAPIIGNMFIDAFTATIKYLGKRIFKIFLDIGSRLGYESELMFKGTIHTIKLYIKNFIAYVKSFIPGISHDKVKNPLEIYKEILKYRKELYNDVKLRNKLLRAYKKNEELMFGVKKTTAVVDKTVKPNLQNLKVSNTFNPEIKVSNTFKPNFQNLKVSNTFKPNIITTKPPFTTEQTNDYSELKGWLGDNKNIIGREITTPKGEIEKIRKAEELKTITELQAALAISNQSNQTISNQNTNIVNNSTNSSSSNISINTPITAKNTHGRGNRSPTTRMFE